MTFKSDTEIAALTAAFRNRTLPKAKWTHAAHWAVALCLIAENEAVARRDMPGMIRAYNEAVGGRNTDSEGYHETITVASLRAASHEIASASFGTPLHVVLANLMSGPYGKPDWIFTYWSRECVFSFKARREWVEPDVQPLPF
ncbi:MAG: hypothetical protein R3C13_07445 [Hyphomonas sp.]|uniref:hypothetical protein n=1 Tax=Hyphomonas sp. TaxID=87 RepID=UPI0035271EF0